MEMTMANQPIVHTPGAKGVVLEECLFEMANTNPGIGGRTVRLRSGPALRVTI